MRRAVFHFRLFTHTAQSAPVHRAVLLGKCVSTSANCHFNWNLLSVCLFHLTIVLLNLATHTHSIWSSDRIHSFTFIYIHKQVFMRPLEERVYLILPTIKALYFNAWFTVWSLERCAKAKTKNHWWKLIQTHTTTQKISFRPFKEKKKKDDICFFSDSPFLFFCYVYTFSVGVNFFLNKYPNGMQREVRWKKLHWQE